MSGTLTTGWRIDSRTEVYSPTEWGLTENGKQWGVDLGDTQRRRFVARRIMTDAEWSTLITLYESNQSVSGAGNTSVSFDDESDSPPTTYTVEFLARPTRVDVGVNLSEVTVALIEVG